MNCDDPGDVTRGSHDGCAPSALVPRAFKLRASAFGFLSDFVLRILGFRPRIRPRIRPQRRPRWGEGRARQGSNLRPAA